MPIYPFVRINHIGKALSVQALKAALDRLPEDAVIAPNETTKNLSIFTPDGRNVGQIDFLANVEDDVIELFEVIALR